MEPSGSLRAGRRSNDHVSVVQHCPLRVAVWSMRMRSGLVSSFRLASLARVRLAAQDQAANAPSPTR